MIVANKLKQDVLTSTIIGSAIEVHKVLGPGLLESIYEECLVYELQKKGLRIDRQIRQPIVYKGITLPYEYRLDLVVEDAIIIEIKSVSELALVHEAQLLSYLKIRGGGIGLLINFNVSVLKEGIRRLII